MHRGKKRQRVTKKGRAKERSTLRKFVGSFQEMEMAF